MTKCSSKTYYPSKQEAIYGDSFKLWQGSPASQPQLQLLHIIPTLQIIIHHSEDRDPNQAKSRPCYKTEETQETRKWEHTLDQGLCHRKGGELISSQD